MDDCGEVLEVGLSPDERGEEGAAEIADILQRYGLVYVFDEPIMQDVTLRLECAEFIEEARLQ